MKAVEREYRVALVLRDQMIEALKRNPSILAKEHLNQSDLDNLKNNLASTFLIRLFAEFETGLRGYWKMGLARKSNTPIRGIIDTVSSKRNVEDIDWVKTHLVRKYRNKLVHEEDSGAEAVEVGDARKSLCVFFSKLPEDW